MTHVAATSATPPIAIQALPERIGDCRRLPETSSEWHAASPNECSTYHYYSFCYDTLVKYVLTLFNQKLTWNYLWFPICPANSLTTNWQKRNIRSDVPCVFFKEYL